MTNPLFDIILIAGGVSHPWPHTLTAPAKGDPPCPPKRPLYRRAFKHIAQVVRKKITALRSPRRVTMDVVDPCIGNA